MAPRGRRISPQPPRRATRGVRRCSRRGARGRVARPAARNSALMRAAARLRGAGAARGRCSAGARCRSRRCCGSRRRTPQASWSAACRPSCATATCLRAAVGTKGSPAHACAAARCSTLWRARRRRTAREGGRVWRVTRRTKLCRSGHTSPRPRLLPLSAGRRDRARHVVAGACARGRGRVCAVSALLPAASVPRRLTALLARSRMLTTT